MKIIMFFLMFLISFFMSCMKKDINKDLEKINLKIKNQVFSIELAKNEEQRRIGLMNRKTMDDLSGMLFIFDKDQKLNFWMKNTLIPLSIAYIDKDGVILELHNMKSQSLQGVDSNHFVRYALELNLHTFEKYGIKVGDKIDLSQIKK